MNQLERLGEIFMSGECDKCGVHTLECLCKKRVKLKAFKEKESIGSMNTKCHIRGCRSLETCCKDCGRVVNTINLSMQTWIPISFQLPEDNILVLCANQYNDFISFGRYTYQSNNFDLTSLDKKQVDSFITHWMEIPELNKT